MNDLKQILQIAAGILLCLICSPIIIIMFFYHIIQFCRELNSDIKAEVSGDYIGKI